MRVAFNTFPDALVGQLGSLLSRQTRLQQQAATGKRLSQLEDDPAAMRTVLDLQAQGSQNAQYRRNIAALQSRATASYSAMQQLQKLNARAREIATLAGGNRSPQELQTYAAEVKQLVEQGVQVLNSQYQGEYLFGGTQSTQPPFTVAKDAAGNITGVAYHGNESVPASEIAAGFTLAVQAPGANPAGSGPMGLAADARNGSDFFGHLLAFQNHLAAGDTASIAATDLDALGKDEENLTLQISANGLVQAQLQTADTVAASRATALRKQISQESDADLAETLTQLSAAQTAYQAALQSGASLLSRSQSLLDYVR